MDCAKMLGYNVIQYNSSKTSYHENVVLFNPDDDKIIYKSKPQIHIYRRKEPPQKYLIDL